MALVDRFELVQVLPCLADGSKIRITAELGTDIEEALPYLNSVIKSAVYNSIGKSLTIKKDGMFFTFRGRSINATKLRDVDHANQELHSWIELINRTWERRQMITPSFERRMELTALQIFRALPSTNCKQCGFVHCLAFAVKLLSDSVSVMACRPLFTPEWRAKRLVLLEILDAAGYPVPPEFMKPG
jgi:ArsR family metal-binding transcriptional regulator